MKTKKKLLFVTGTRADFGKLEPLATAVFKNGFAVIFLLQACICLINMD